VTVLKSLGEGRYEGLEEVLAIARSVGWGAADILRSYYRATQTTATWKSMKKRWSRHRRRCRRQPLHPGKFTNQS
jgi:hypothetical protein